jgi:hypothetical protein
VVLVTQPTGKEVEVSVLDITWPKGLLSSLEGEENEDVSMDLNLDLCQERICQYPQEHRNQVEADTSSPGPVLLLIT